MTVTLEATLGLVAALSGGFRIRAKLVGKLSGGRHEHPFASTDAPHSPRAPLPGAVEVDMAGAGAAESSGSSPLGMTAEVSHGPR